MKGKRWLFRVAIPAFKLSTRMNVTMHAKLHGQFYGV